MLVTFLTPPLPHEENCLNLVKDAQQEQITAKAYGSR